MSMGGPQSLDARFLRHRTGTGSESESALAADLLAASRATDALEVTTGALERRPDDPDLLVLDARARLSQGDLLGAQGALLRAAKVAPQRAEPFRWLGEVLLKRGDPVRASKVLERAASLDRSDPTIAQLRARADRLARLAEEASAEVAPPESDSDDLEERTVIRADLTEHLRTLVREEARASEAEPPLTLAQPPGVSADRFEDESTGTRPPVGRDDFEDEPTGTRPPVGHDDFEDEPTNIVHASSLPPFKPAVAPKRRVARTLTFGSEVSESPAGVPEPAKPTPFGGGRLPAKLPPPPRKPLPPATSTLVGAAAPPPEPRRTPASALPAPALPAPALPSVRSRSPAGRLSDPPLSPELDDPFPPTPERLPEPLPAAREAAPTPFAPARLPDPFAPPAAREAIPDPFADPPPSAAVAPAPEPFPAVPASSDPEPEAPAELPADLPAEALADVLPDVLADRRADVAVGGGEREDVDGILDMLESQGLFERPEGAAEPAQWARRAEVKQTQGGGTRVGLWLGLVWALAAALVAGGYFGWTAWTDHQRSRAALLVEQATQAAYRGDYSTLVDAERYLREARDLDGRDASGPTLLLFVHAQRALEDGSFQAGYMRPAILRGEAVQADGAYLDMARAVLAAAEAQPEEAAQRLEAALTARPRDPAILYLAGRLEQRLGHDTAVEHLQAAVQGEAQLVAPRIALAEVRYDEGQAEDALELLGQVLEREADHLRARLWRAFLTSDGDDPAAALRGLDAVQETVQEHGAPTDRVLLELSRSRLLRRQGDLEAAGEAVDRALLAGASEPRLLALVATEGRRAGRLLRAEQAARTAVSGAPHSADFRKLLAGIELDRRNGRGALATLANLDAADPDVVRMRAEAALLVGTEEALRTAVAALDEHVAANAEAPIEVRALRIRIHARLGGVPDLVAQGQALAREAPGDPSVTLALGEAALRASDGPTAEQALSQAALAAPDDAEVHYLLGRARRMTGQAEGAEESLRRAVELSAEHVEARLALGGLLLDTGRYTDAEELYAELARSARSTGGQAVTVAGRLGRVEALLGLGRLDDAQVQLEGLSADVREAPTARVLAARLALARGRPGDALGSLRALATAEDASPALVALYADALLAAGQVEPAAEAYARAIAQDAGLPEGLLGQADLAVRTERRGDALPLLDRAERALGQRIRPPAMLARVHLLRGRAQLLGGRDELTLAREALRRAVAIEGVPPEAHFYLGEALAGQNSPESRASYERYLELAPQGSLAARARRAVGGRSGR